MMKQRRKLSKKEQKAAAKTVATFVAPAKKEIISEKKEVCLPDVVLVMDFADRAGIPVTQIISQLMKNGVLATINETIDFETAAIIGDDLNLKIIKEEACEKKLTSRIKVSEEEKDKKNLVKRPPVVTIMGHVDHGKTTLLDNIREANVAGGESGGITQHISAYQVTLKEVKNTNLKNRVITFIDTPGHAAFSAMRGHGTSITDIVVLIVAANDGVMPQTIEVIEKAKENNVPVIVAINKIDLPDADEMKVKQQLSEYELVPEEWGGKTIMVPISAKTGQGINDLLEMILLQADMMNVCANPNEAATGIVIESYMGKGSGPMALVLIENGTLRKGDPIAIGSSYGRIRMLEDYIGKPISEAGPSYPTRIAGLKSLPNFGDRLIVFSSEKEARETALKAAIFTSKVNIATAKKIESEKTPENEKTQNLELDIVLKADVNGSLEAIKKLLSEINSEEIIIKIVADGVGSVSESDVILAKTTSASVIGFRVKALGAAKKIAEKEKIQIKTFDVIYELIQFIKDQLSDLLPPEVIEEEIGRGEILAIFRDDKKSYVAGGRIESGHISVGDEIKIFQKGNEKYKDKVVSLRKEKNEVKECASGTECGLGLSPGANIAVGDTFLVYRTTHKKRTIE